MPRYRELAETEMDDAQRRIFNDCKAGPRGAVPPPVHVWLKSPALPTTPTSSGRMFASARSSRRARPKSRS